MPKLSVYMVTFNEEARLERTLKAAKQVADELVIVDSGSTDNTTEIAKKFGAKVIYNPWETYCQQKNFAENQCANDWVLLLDADEVLSPEIIAEIKTLMQNPEAVAYKLKIVDMLPHDKKPAPFAQTFNPVRLYNRQFATMPPDKMNKDRIEVKEGQKIGQIKAKVYHYSFISVAQALDKFNRHSIELQKTLKKDGKRYSVLRLITEFPRQFCRYYVAHGYIFWGSEGFIYANILAWFRFLKIARRFEDR